ncbi:DNA polymerase IV [Natronomonas sp. EA1]|uniref:DNA polymerase IV n=1 Tax=Natronomonas sp. EA1 TaxID=3421655 RepID=UPI003EBC930F
MARGRLPGVERDERVVCHVDMDCFYAACERLREPALEGEPVVVGMGYEPGETIGAVATASYEAREFGVDSAMPITEALSKLPRKVDAAKEGNDPSEAGFYRPVDMAYYKEVSREVKAVLHDLVSSADPDGVVREVSIDEAYLDVSGVGWDGAEAFAYSLKKCIAEEVGVTASVGVAPNMSTAKVASDYEKPDGCTVVRPEDVEAFLAPLPVSELHGVGPKTAATLAEEGIETAGELAAAAPSLLKKRFGERGKEIHAHAQGRDDRAVTPVGKPKSLSSESALPPTSELETKRDIVRGLASEVAERADSKGALYRTIGIKVVEPPFEVNTRATSLPGPVANPDLVERTALSLLEEFDDVRVRKLGVRVSNLSFSDAEQASLAGFETGDMGSEVERPRSFPSRPARGQTSLQDFE